MGDAPWGFYEFFAGGGMARLGLGARWRCLFANDNSAPKARSYQLNFGGDELVVRDVGALSALELPGRASLAWASFPCQDLSLAGAGGGLAGRRSGAFWPFWRLMEELSAQGRAPDIVALENVAGAITSSGGADLQAILAALARGGLRFAPLVVDAVHFVPQSRPRLFIIAFRADLPAPEHLFTAEPLDLWRPKSLLAAHAAAADEVRARWVWLNLPAPPPRRTTLTDVLEDDPVGVRWHEAERTARLLDLMSPVNLDKVRRAQQIDGRIAGALYRRTRVDEQGRKIQRAEVRFDQVSGCLRTPAGGSSRQLILVVEGAAVRSRLLSPREAARLMGVPEDYKLPAKYNEAYHLMGDAVVAPVVAWLEEHVLAPLAAAATSTGGAT